MNFKKICALLMVFSTLLLCACGNSPVEPETTAPTVAPTTAPPETTLPPETTQPTEPEIELHSGIREDGTFDGGTLFIGDSLTYGLVYSYLMENDLIGDARYMSIVGASVQAYFQGPSLAHEQNSLFSPEFIGLTYSQAVEQVGSEITAIYFMMGTNYSEGTKASTYIEIIDHMMEHCPNATIYLQMVPFAMSTNVEYDIVNWVIMETHTHYAMEGNPRVKLVDVKHAIGVNLTPDGVHLTYKGQECWYNALVEYAETNSIPQ